MRRIKISKINIDNLEILNEEIKRFILNKSSKMLAIKHSDKWYSELLQMDIAQSLFNDFQVKIIRASKAIVSINVKVSEAIVIIQAIIEARPEKQSKEANVLENFKIAFHQQIINI